jgi:hypothetical protein
MKPGFTLATSLAIGITIGTAPITGNAQYPAGSTNGVFELHRCSGQSRRRQPPLAGLSAGGPSLPVRSVLLAQLSAGGPGARAGSSAAPAPGTPRTGGP